MHNCIQLCIIKEGQQLKLLFLGRYIAIGKFFVLEAMSSMSKHAHLMHGGY